MSSSRRYEERSRSPRRRDRSRSPRAHRDYDSRRYSDDKYEDDHSKRRKYDDERRDEGESRRRDPPRSVPPPRAEMPTNTAPDHPALNSIHRGLVHVSQVSNYRIERAEDLKEMFAPGDDVLVKVISIDESTGKYSLSIKYVNQRDGTDLDPAGTQAKQAQQRKSGERGERPDNRIRLEYKYDVTCSKCGGMGHLASECFSGPQVTAGLQSEEPTPGEGSAGSSDLVERRSSSSAPRAAPYSMVPENTNEDQWFDVIQMQREMEEAKLNHEKQRRKEERRLKREEREKKRQDKKKRRKEKKDKKEKHKSKRRSSHKSKKRKRDSSSSSSSGSSNSSDSSSSSDSESESRSR